MWFCNIEKCCGDIAKVWLSLSPSIILNDCSNCLLVANYGAKCVHLVSIAEENHDSVKYSVWVCRTIPEGLNLLLVTQRLERF